VLGTIMATAAAERVTFGAVCEEAGMNITLDGASEAFVEQLVQGGRYASPQKVKLAALRALVDEGLAGDDRSEKEFDASIDAVLDTVKRAYPQTAAAAVPAPGPGGS